METFNYQIFTIRYIRMLKNTYSYVLLSPNGKEIYRDYISIDDNSNIQLLITKKLETFLTKQCISKFKVEIFFVGQEWKPCVMITLGDEIICEEFKPNEQNLSKILDLITFMLNENSFYNGYNIINFNKYGKNSEQKNLCAYKQKNNGKYDCIYAQNLELLKQKLNYK